MKAKNLQILKENGMNVPNFIVVNDGDDIDLSFSHSMNFAVRSSFYLEDEEEHSFAGQFRTILNVERENVRDAVVEVRKSYGSESSPVIIQEMVVPDMSGVLFTANPLGILNEAVITVGYGLGENIVTDRAETVTYYYNKDEAIFYLKEKSDISISNKMLNALMDISSKIRDIFGKEMDIEFAIRDEIIYILQARPITTLKVENLLILDNSNIVESYPGVSLPVTLDFVHNVYRDIFRSCVFRITKDDALVKEMEDIFSHMVADYNGSIYYQITNWYEILKLLPFSNRIIKIWQEMLGVDNKMVNTGNLKVSKFMKLKICLAFIYYLMITPKSMKKLNQYFDIIYPEYKEKIRKTNTIEGLLMVLTDVENSITSVWDITLINDMYAFLFTALSGGKKNEKIANIKNIESMKPVRAMNELRQIAKDKGTDSLIYQKKEQEYIESFGDRILGELKLETKTYRTNPELLREQLLSTKNILIETSNHKKVSGISINPFVHAAKSGIANREKSRLNRCRLFGLARDIVLKIGSFMVQNSQLDKKEDVFYLYFEEMNSTAKYQALIQKRKEQFNSYQLSPHPRRIVFCNGVTESRRIAYDGQFHDIATLQGTQTSLGKVIGEAIVIHEVHNNQDVKDKIIITKSTDPGWVFLIEKCKGIVAEQGSILSHTAIISRELGKPAIVNVKDATKIMKTGDLIELDANSGIIRILKRAVVDGN